MATQRVNITTPVGRVVEGSLYKPNTTNFDGKPLTVQSGKNAGQPRVDYFFALAIPKGQEQHWAHTEWGKLIWQVGHTAFPQAAQRPDFAWKVVDGDSQVPNKKNTKPCDKDGYPGHWVMRLSGGFAPKIYRQEGSSFVQVVDADYIKPGYFIQVSLSVDGNGNQNNSGVYLNHQQVCFRAYGEEIYFGASPEDAGFGAAPLPAGASMTPPASTVPMPTGVPAAALPTVGAAAPPPPVPVTPNPQFLQVPQDTPAAAINAPMIPAVQVPPPMALPVVPASASPSSGPQLTALAKGVSYQAYIAAGWTDDALRANGIMI